LKLRVATAHKPIASHAAAMLRQNFLIRFGMGNQNKEPEQVQDHLRGVVSTSCNGRLSSFFLQVLDPRTERVLHCNENLKKLAYFFKSKAHLSLERMNASHCFTSYVFVSCILMYPDVSVAFSLPHCNSELTCGGTRNRYFHDGNV